MANWIIPHRCGLTCGRRSRCSWPHGGRPGDDHVVAHGQTGDALADGGDDAGALVAEDERGGLRDGAVHGREVRVADAGGLDLDRDLTRARVGWPRCRRRPRASRHRCCGARQRACGHSPWLDYAAMSDPTGTRSNYVQPGSSQAYWSRRRWVALVISALTSVGAGPAVDPAEQGAVPDEVEDPGHVGPHLGVEVVGHGPVHDPGEGAGHLALARGRALVRRGDGQDHGLGELGLALHGLGGPAQHVADAVGRGAALGRAAGDAALEVVGPGHQRGRQQVVLGREVAVDRAQGDLGPRPPRRASARRRSRPRRPGRGRPG